MPRTVGGSVIRNRVQRQLRALMRERLEILPSGALVVIRVNPAARGARSAELGRDLDRALSRLLAPAADPEETGRRESTVGVPARPGEGSA